MQECTADIVFNALGCSNKTDLLRPFLEITRKKIGRERRFPHIYFYRVRNFAKEIDAETPFYYCFGVVCHIIDGRRTGNEHNVNVDIILNEISLQCSL